MGKHYIGIMSGTSGDGIDAVVANFESSTPKLLGTLYLPYSKSMREKIHALCESGENEIERLGELDRELGIAFAKAVNQLLSEHNISKEEVIAIGSHGQTI